MAADAEIVRISYTELEERANLIEEKQSDSRKAQTKEGKCRKYLTWQDDFHSKAEKSRCLRKVKWLQTVLILE